MARSVSGILGRIVLTDVFLASLIAGLGLLLAAMKIPIEGHPVLSILFGRHGFLFGLVLPLLLDSLVPLVVVSAVAAIMVSRNN